MPRAGTRASRALAALAPVAFLATGACVATRTDIRVLQQDLAVMRAESAQRDSAQARQVEQLLARLVTVNDSLLQLSARLVRFQGDALEDHVKIQEQLIQVQSLTGQSQRVIRELRASLEEARENPAVAPAATPAPSATPGDTGARPAGVAPGTTAGAQVTPAAPTATGPGPTQLFELANAQLRRGSTGAAREGFQQLLVQYPQSDLAPDAQYYVAETLAAENQSAAADSAYRLVPERWPNAPRAATALYKLGLSLERQGRRAEARAALDDVVRRYPRSDEAVLARERVRTLQ